MQAPPQRGLSLNAVYVLAALVIVALRPLLVPIPPFDFWWHLALGRQIAATGHIPAVDTFSFTQAGREYFDQSWAAQLLLYGLHRLGGVPLIVAVQALVLAGAYGLLLWVAIRRSGRLRLAVVLLVFAVEPVSFSNWLVRPQSYALPLFAGFLAVLTGYRMRWWRALWPLPLLMAIWANLHGSFPLGLALIALVLLGERIRRAQGDAGALSPAEWRRLALWGAATAGAALCNPRGPGIVRYVGGVMASPSVTRVATEWAPPSPGEWGGALFTAFVLFLFTAMAYARRRPDATDVAILLPLLWLSFSATRNVVWFAMAALPPLADTLASYHEKRMPDARGIPTANALLAGLLLLGLSACLPWTKPAGDLVSRDTPIAAVRHLRSLPAGVRPQRLFHTLGFGSYLTWAAPEQKVFLDPRFELYPYQQWQDYTCLCLGIEVPTLLARYRIDGLLLGPGEAALRRRALAGGWHVVYEDERAALLLPPAARVSGPVAVGAPVGRFARTEPFTRRGGPLCPPASAQSGPAQRPAPTKAMAVPSDPLAAVSNRRSPLTAPAHRIPEGAP